MRLAHSTPTRTVRRCPKGVRNPADTEDSTAPSVVAHGGGLVVRDELGRLFHWEARHRRLAARVLLAISSTVLVLVVGSLFVWLFESGKPGSDIHGYGGALFFTLVQLFTVSSSMSNPVTSAGRVVDVELEAWDIFVVTAIAGSFSAFFSSGDAG